MTVETFTYAPTRESQRSMAPRVKKVAFGNGYQQVYRDGINSILETWSLTFTETASDAIIIDNFFKARGGVEYFNWTSRGLQQVVKQFLCTAWQISPAGGCFWTITATFEEWAGLIENPPTIMTADLVMDSTLPLEG